MLNVKYSYDKTLSVLKLCKHNDAEDDLFTHSFFVAGSLQPEQPPRGFWTKRRRPTSKESWGLSDIQPCLAGPIHGAVNTQRNSEQTGASRYETPSNIVTAGWAEQHRPSPPSPAGHAVRYVRPTQTVQSRVKSVRTSAGEGHWLSPVFKRIKCVVLISWFM